MSEEILLIVSCCCANCSVCSGEIGWAVGLTAFIVGASSGGRSAFGILGVTIFHSTRHYLF